MPWKASRTSTWVMVFRTGSEMRRSSGGIGRGTLPPHPEVLVKARRFLAATKGSPASRSSEWRRALGSGSSSTVWGRVQVGEQLTAGDDPRVLRRPGAPGVRQAVKRDPGEAPVLTKHLAWFGDKQVIVQNLPYHERG